MARPVVLVNQSTKIPDQAYFEKVVAAYQRQVSEHYAPHYCDLQLSAAQADPKKRYTPTVETIFFLDNADVAGALGYHDLLASDVPVGYVFVETTLDDGEEWEVTGSHELLEQAADPYVNLGVVVTFPPKKPKPPHGPHHHDDKSQKKAFLAYETADPTEEDVYLIDGIPVSNFVLPAWFQDIGKPVGPFDYMGKLTAPLTLTRGGYVAYMPLGQTNWRQYTADARIAHVSRFKRKHRRHVKARG